MIFDRNRITRLAIAAAAVCLSTGVSAGGGRGGDSSMNPFTGDSYAYFHGGHNLGEQGMNIPWRSQPPNAPKGTAESTRDTPQSAPPRRQSFYPAPQDPAPPRQ